MDGLDRRSSDSFVDNNFILQETNYGLDTLSKLNVLRTENCFTDAILCVGTEEFPCHRNVMAVSSPYFKAMFSSDLRESREVRISFNEISASTLEKIIEYAYTGRIEMNIDNAQEVLAAGSLFQYQPIVDACCKFLSKHLHASNCLGIENFAHLHNCTNLETEAHEFALDDFSSVVEYEEFLEMPVERLVTYIASDLIDVRTEETVFDAVVKWLQNDLENRKHHLGAVLEHIRLATINVDYLNSVVLRDPLIQNSEYCISLVNDAKKCHASIKDTLGQRRRSMQQENCQPRPSTVAKEVMVLVGGINNIYNILIPSVEMYDPYKDRWHPLPDMPKSVSGYSVAALKNCIYVTGGITDGQIVASVWIFDSLKRKWFDMPSMLMPRARHASTSWSDKLYVVGGVSVVADSKYSPAENIECFDLEKQQWSIVGQSPFPRKLSHLVPFNQTLVEVGGTQGGARVQTMESYLCSEEKVVYSGEQFVLPEPIQFSQILAINGIFYIIWEDSKKLISLNPEKRTFRRLADMNYSHTHGGATVVGGNIYVTGGLVDSKPSKVTEYYNPVTNEWTVVRNMCQARGCHGCVTIQMCT